MGRVLNEGHNGGVSEGTFFHHVKQLGDLKKQASTIAGKIRAQKQQAKEDGIEVPDLEWAVKQQARPIEEQIETQNRRLSYLRFLKMPIGTQMEFIDPKFSEDVGLTDEQREEKWYNAGFTASGTSLSRDACPHDPNSEAGRKWLEGYEANQKLLLEEIKKTPAAKDPAEKKDGKPKGKAAGDPPTPVPAEEPKKRGRPAKAKGMSYWHKADAKTVHEISEADAPPEGAIAITRPEFDRLKAEYEAADKEAWEAAEKAGAPDGAETTTDDPPTPGDEPVDDGFDDAPPAP